MSERGRDLARALGRRAAEAGLGLRDARALFDALYDAHALVRSQGCVSQAARIAGLAREALHRRRRRREDQ